jgi:hypothetical protein
MKTIEIRPDRVADFIHVNKKIFNWRYITYRLLKTGKINNGSDTLFWIGIINISGEGPYEEICFANKKYELVADGQTVYKEGTSGPRQKEIYNYDLKKISPLIVQARRLEQRYVHLFLKETVNVRGEHEIAFFNFDWFGEGDRISMKGSVDKKPWFEQQIIDWLQYRTVPYGWSSATWTTILKQEMYYWEK